MSTPNNNLLGLQQEQICYVQCGFCTTVLVVSVPCNWISRVVTVRCGHCTSLLSVNMTTSSFIPLPLPLHLFSSLNNQQQAKVEGCNEEEEEEVRNAVALMNKHSPSPLIPSSSSDEEDDGNIVLINHIVNKPPERRQRAPSAYNNFIKEEIRRLKTKNPNMAHKQAFSTAAKNWAHTPPSQQNEGEEKSKGSRDFTQ